MSEKSSIVWGYVIYNIVLLILTGFVIWITESLLGLLVLLALGSPKRFFNREE